MDLDAVIRDLQRRRAVLDEAIAVFERLVEAEKLAKAPPAAAGRRRKAKPGARKKAPSS